MFVVARLTTDLPRAGLHALKWFVHEFVRLTIRPTAGSQLANLCRIIGCVVTVVSLRVALRDGLLPNTTHAAIQLGFAGLTAILFGNVAKEFAFDLAARVTMCWGHAFIRNGLTVGGKSFWDIQFRDGTWMRCEKKYRQAICEWTEPDGRCNRLELRAHDPKEAPPSFVKIRTKQATESPRVDSVIGTLLGTTALEFQVRSPKVRAVELSSQ